MEKRGARTRIYEILLADTVLTLVDAGWLWLPSGLVIIEGNPQTGHQGARLPGCGVLWSGWEGCGWCTEGGVELAPYTLVVVVAVNQLGVLSTVTRVVGFGGLSHSRSKKKAQTSKILPTTTPPQPLDSLPDTALVSVTACAWYGTSCTRVTHCNSFSILCRSSPPSHTTKSTQVYFYHDCDDTAVALATQ